MTLTVKFGGVEVNQRLMLIQELFGSVKSVDEFRTAITAFESQVVALDAPVPELELTHSFGPGVYMRELFIPKDTFLTGRIHKEAHLNLIPNGDIVVATEEGIKRIKGPAKLVSPVGVKRLGYTLADTTWITVHRTDCTDPEEIERMLTTTEYSEVELCLS